MGTLLFVERRATRCPGILAAIRGRPWGQTMMILQLLEAAKNSRSGSEGAAQIIDLLGDLEPKERIAGSLMSKADLLSVLRRRLARGAGDLLPGLEAGISAMAAEPGEFVNLVAVSSERGSANVWLTPGGRMLGAVVKWSL